MTRRMGEDMNANDPIAPKKFFRIFLKKEQ